jgi:hypothetical protein
MARLTSYQRFIRKQERIKREEKRKEELESFINLIQSVIKEHNEETLKNKKDN